MPLSKKKKKIMLNCAFKFVFPNLLPYIQLNMKQGVHEFWLLSLLIISVSHFFSFSHFVFDVKYFCSLFMNIVIIRQIAVQYVKTVQLYFSRKPHCLIDKSNCSVHLWMKVVFKLCFISLFSIYGMTESSAQILFFFFVHCLF